MKAAYEIIIMVSGVDCITFVVRRRFRRLADLSTTKHITPRTKAMSAGSVLFCQTFKSKPVLHVGIHRHAVAAGVAMTKLSLSGTP